MNNNRHAAAPLTDSEARQVWWDSLSEDFRNGYDDARLHAAESWPTADSDAGHWSAQTANYRAGYRYGQATS